MNDIQKWGDAQQYGAAPMKATYDEKTGVMPRVELVWMTPDPLGAIAAACRMYEGKPTYDLADITDEDRMHYWNQARSTHLKAPLEFVNFHFFIEGVDRAFTHQLVRQRTAVYAQESMRFAVMDDDLLERTSLPPSLHGTKTNGGELYNFQRDLESSDQRKRWRARWDRTLAVIEAQYEALVNDGMPAEEARGLLPHATATRLNYSTNLRGLLDHAGNRLCTQAQFHWRFVFAQIAKAISEYEVLHRGRVVSEDHHWQYKELASAFRPVCYEMGRCPFKADFDRDCSIRDRVDANAAIGRPSSQWNERLGLEGQDDIPAISSTEWMLNPEAARRH